MRDKSGRYVKGKVPEEVRKRFGSIWKGRKKTKEHLKKISESKKGNKNPNFGKHPTKETLLKRSKSLKGKTPWNKGKKCPQLVTNWQGGISTVNHIIRHSLEYRLWRTAVFERDNYTCIWCGQRGGRLNADHIKPFAYYPELRFAIDNGRTLCENCHKTTETYGKGGKWLLQ